MTINLRGRNVLAKQTPHGPTAKQYANLTAAQKAAEKAHGVAFRFPGGRPWYVWINSSEQQS